MTLKQDLNARTEFAEFRINCNGMRYEISFHFEPEWVRYTVVVMVEHSRGWEPLYWKFYYDNNITEETALSFINNKGAETTTEIKP